jgi:hypothetical protein
MGPMVRGRRLDRRKVVRLSAVGLVALFAWSLAAAPASVSQTEVAPEPPELDAYSTFADAVPVASYFDHKSPLPAPAFGVSLAHSNTTVNQPSAASGIAWLLDLGLANGLHGTTTGASVPTEASARQPGGAPAAEFKTAGGPVGEDEFGRVAAGWSRATATQAGAPRGFAHAFLGNVLLFPAAGTPPEPPGTYDPDATFPGGDNLAPIPDPGPQNQMGILAVGSVASTSESIRQGDTVTSVAVAEVQGLNIGNRTSDNRCTNCFVIDAIRVEAFARTNGRQARAAYRVMLGRACRRTFVPGVIEHALGETPPPKEEDQCLGPNPPEPYTFDGSDERVRRFNELFGEPIVLPGLTCPGTGEPCTTAIRIQLAQPGHADPRRPERTVNPPESACRNYAYPDPSAKGPVPACEALPELIRPPTGPDRDNGQVAKAVAEGVDIEILTLVGAQFIPQSADLDRCFGIFDALPPPPEGLPPEAGEVLALAACPVAGLRAIREVNLTLGIAQASAVARPATVAPPEGETGGPPAPPTVPGPVPPVPLPTGPLPGLPQVGIGTTVVGGGGGLGPGRYALKIDWSSLRVRPLPPKDMAKAVASGAIVAGAALLVRRRLRLSSG